MGKRAKKDHLELFRGLAILAVLMIHVTSTPIVTLPMNSTLYPLYHIVNTVSHFAVPAFIFLSALVMFYQYDDVQKHSWSSFFFKRFQVIAIPYVLWSIFYYVLVIRIEGKTIEESWPSFLKHLLIGSNYPHLYFIIVIVQFYLLFPLLHRILYQKAIRTHLLSVGILSQTAFYLLNYHYWHLKKIGSLAPSYLLFYCLGASVGLAIQSTDGIFRMRKWIFYTWFLLAAAYSAQMWMQRADPHWVPRSWLSAINFAADYSFCAISCLALLQLSQLLSGLQWARLRMFIYSIGATSLGIYYVHPFLLLVWRKKFMSNDPILYHPLTWIGGAIALFLSWGFTVVIQRRTWGSLIVGKSAARRGKRNPLAVEPGHEPEKPSRQENIQPRESSDSA
ncbi:acyltransferase [Paenibacillus solisilvae]|uniref:Acyltransferase n=1 Tax=Paenibacillus solisilvae TaxID=2486751 RepID=A0ABW0W2G8_9BACL